MYENNIKRNLFQMKLLIAFNGRHPSIYKYYQISDSNEANKYTYVIYKQYILLKSNELFRIQIIMIDRYFLEVLYL